MMGPEVERTQTVFGKFGKKQSSIKAADLKMADGSKTWSLILL